MSHQEEDSNDDPQTQLGLHFLYNTELPKAAKDIARRLSFAIRPESRPPPRFLQETHISASHKSRELRVPHVNHVPR